MTIALIQKYERFLSRFKDDLPQNPDAVKKYAAELREIEGGNERQLLRTLLLELYDGEVDSLKRDLLKSQMLGAAKATPTERAVLLRYLYRAVSLYVTQDNFAEFLDMLDGGAAIIL